MSIVNAKELLIEATNGKYAVGAFNITSLVQMEAIIEMASELRAPVIVQTSVSPARFLGVGVMVAAYRALAETAPIPIVLHLDHSTDVGFCKQCADAGYTNIMIDASKLPYEDNVRQTRAVASYCHSLGDVSVEGELGTVSGVEDQVRVVESEAELCNPAQALDYVERTDIDLLAPAIGTAHGVYKTRNPKIDTERFRQIFTLINGSGVRVPLVVHGGTGLPHETVQTLIAYGGAKVNVSTELKHTLIDATYQYISHHREEYEPGSIDRAVKEATRKTVAAWIDVCGSAGKA